MQGTIVKSEPLPTGEYPVTVVNIEDCEGNFGPQVKFTLEFLGEEYQGKQIYAWASAKLSTSSKLAQWSKAFGFPFVAGAEFDTDCLIGAEAVAVVLKKSKDNGDGEAYNYVEDIQSGPDPFKRE